MSTHERQAARRRLVLALAGLAALLCSFAAMVALVAFLAE